MQRLISKVFMWMFIGLLISFGTAYFVSTNPNMIFNLLGRQMYFIFIIEIGLVIWLELMIHKMKVTTAYFLFCLYSFFTGLTLSVIFLVFDIQSILSIFGVTAILFLAMSTLGYNTKYDLTKVGNILLIGLIGIVLFGIINMFIGNTFVNIALAIVGIIIFMGYTAYDMKMIKRSYEIYGDNEKVSIILALNLYLDFINIFLKLLSLFGKRK